LLLKLLLLQEKGDEKGCPGYQYDYQRPT